eukprot:6671911-Pyramimonas_sp.AAC.1
MSIRRPLRGRFREDVSSETAMFQKPDWKEWEAFLCLRRLIERFIKNSEKHGWSDVLVCCVCLPCWCAVLCAEL